MINIGGRMRRNHFYITGYVGEGAKRMLKELENAENVILIPEEIENRLIRFLYYRVMNMIGFRKETKIKKTFQKEKPFEKSR